MVSMPIPRGVTAPSPVITTRLSMRSSPSAPPRLALACRPGMDTDVRAGMTSAACSHYKDSAQQYNMGVTRHQQTLAPKGGHMAPRLTLARVEQCLQQGKAEAARLGVQAAIVVVDA